MIPSRQLQLGNYVLDEQGEVFRIDAMDFVRDGYDCKLIEYIGVDRRTLYSLESHPIPLTEDWLVRFGFEKSQGGLRKKLRFGQISAPIIDTHIKLWYHYYGTSIINDIIYVHQLQNLYYALTHQELKLQE